MSARGLSVTLSIASRSTRRSLALGPAQQQRTLAVEGYPAPLSTLALLLCVWRDVEERRREQQSMWSLRGAVPDTDSCAGRVRSEV